MKKILPILLLTVLVMGVKAQTFDEYFDGRNLRLDYILAGDSMEQAIYFEQAYVTTQWAGRRARLAETPLRGNGQVRLYDHDTGKLIYTHTFSTLFQEWQATEEATHVKKAFQTSFNVPMPRKAVDVSVVLTDFHANTAAQLTHTINPDDILIRKLSKSTFPHYYICKGGKFISRSSDSLDGREVSDDKEPDIVRCIDLAVVAEGYTRQQMDKFYADCRRLADALFAHEPFTSMKDRFNIVAVAAESPQSGTSVPHQKIWNATPANTHYDTFYTNRYLMTQDMHRLYNLLAGVPFEHVIVLVNSDTYGGGGIYNQLTVTTSDHPTFNQVLVHEFGHAYGGLGDEYFYDDGYTTMYPADTEPWEPNLTTLKDFKSKWADMLPPGTAIPTPADKSVPNYRLVRNDSERQRLNAATQRVGVFEGGGYQSKGVYRPAQECRMKINEVENFCPVCSRAIRSITDFYTSE